MIGETQRRKEFNRIRKRFRGLEKVYSVWFMSKTSEYEDAQAARGQFE